MIKKTRKAVLGALSLESATGYQIKKFLEETVSYFWKESFGQIYPVLSELENEGKVIQVQNSPTGRREKLYSITDSGSEELESWLKSSKYTINPGRHELMLKIFFGYKEVVPNLIEQISTYRNQLSGTMQTFTGFKTVIENDDMDQVRKVCMGATVQSGVISVQSQIKWCDESISKLNGF